MQCGVASDFNLPVAVPLMRSDVRSRRCDGSKPLAFCSAGSDWDPMLLDRIFDEISMTTMNELPASGFEKRAVPSCPEVDADLVGLRASFRC